MKETLRMISKEPGMLSKEPEDTPCPGLLLPPQDILEATCTFSFLNFSRVFKLWSTPPRAPMNNYSLTGFWGGARSSIRPKKTKL